MDSGFRGPYSWGLKVKGLGRLVFRILRPDMQRFWLLGTTASDIGSVLLVGQGGGWVQVFVTTCEGSGFEIEGVPRVSADVF